MEETPIEQRLFDLISEQFGRELSWLSHDTRFETLGADALDLVEFVMLCEETFECTIPEEVAQRMKTIGDLIDFLTDDGSGNAGVGAKLPNTPRTPRSDRERPDPDQLR